MAKKGFRGIIIGLAIVLSATVFAGCATMSDGIGTVVQVQQQDVSRPILGPVSIKGSDISALDLNNKAKELYPEVKNVVITGVKTVQLYLFQIMGSYILPLGRAKIELNGLATK